MTRYLVKQCPKCKGIVKLVVEDGIIMDIQGGVQYTIRAWNPLFSKPSQKLIVCTHPSPNPGRFNEDPMCNRYMNVSTFKEITP